MHGDCAANCIRALAHRDESEPPPCLWAFRVEATAVIVDPDAQAVPFLLQMDAHVLGAGVLERVRNRLLDDSEDLALDRCFGREPTRAVELELDVCAVHPTQH